MKTTFRRTIITAIRGRRVWDSRGRPTVEAEITLAGGATGRAIAPAGASTGSGEALDTRDGGAAFGGYDVMGAVDAVNRELAPALLGMDARAQAALDARLKSQRSGRRILGAALKAAMRSFCAATRSPAGAAAARPSESEASATIEISFFMVLSSGPTRRGQPTVMPPFTWMS